MSDPPRRPILKLKVAPPAARALKSDPEAGARWKCKPCGGIVTITGEEPPALEIRCPACNARLGLAADFRDGGKVRARALPPLRPGA